MRGFILFLCLLFSLPASAQTTLFTESFDSVSPPALPAGWSADGDGWESSTSSASTGSGLVNMVHAGPVSGSFDSPELGSLSATSGVIRYLARRTSSYSADSLAVRGSIDGGMTWPVLVASSGALPTVTSSWEPVELPLPAPLLNVPAIRIRFEALGGSSGGSNLRLDDLIVEVLVPEGPDEGSMGFAEAERAIEPGAVNLPLDLELNVGARIQGLQFDFSWPPDRLTFKAARRGPALADSSSWVLASSGGTSSARVVLFSMTDVAIGPGSYPSLVTLEFDADHAAGADTSEVTLRSLLASAPQPAGARVPLALTEGAVRLVSPNRAGVLVAPDSFSLGDVFAGTAVTQVFEVSNGSEGDSLAVNRISAADPGWSVEPDRLDLAPLGEATIEIRFDASGQSAGSQETLIAFEHDGLRSDRPASVLVIPSRGDANLDRTLDVIDVLLGVDLVVGAVTPDPNLLERLDLQPFPAGDGEVDVRDLTVLIRAILDGTWPDGSPVPAAPASSAAGKGAGSVFLSLETDEAFSILIARVEEAVRAVQMELGAIRPDEAVRGFSASTGSAWAARHSGMVRIIWSRLDGSMIPVGRYELGRWPRARTPFPEAQLVLRSGFAVSESLVRSAITLPGDGTPDAAASEAAPYPNPFRVGEGEVRIPAAGTAQGVTHWSVVDVLGRIVFESKSQSGQDGFRWDGTGVTGRPLSPGLYIVREAAGDQSRVHPVLIMR